MNCVSRDCKKISVFEAWVNQYFGFLEVEYGFKRKQLRETNKDYYRDHAVSIRYQSKDIDVDIGWGIGDAGIGIGIRDRSLYAPVKFIYFDIILECMTNGQVMPVMPDITPDISFAEMGRRADESSRMINDSMESIIKELALRLKKYGDKILKGDTSDFPAFDKFYKEKYGGYK